MVSSFCEPSVKGKSSLPSF